MGYLTRDMAKFIACCALLLAVALAAQKDTIQDLGAVQMIQDDSSMGADVVYRLSFRTQFDSDPAASGYNEGDAKWEAKAGLAQKMNLKAADVGEITGVTITSDAAATDSWTPVFLKVNMNDMASGLGNGIYYMDIGKAIDSGTSYTVTTTTTDTDGNKPEMTNMASHNSGIIKCEAAACEEKMEKKLKATN